MPAVPSTPALLAATPPERRLRPPDLSADRFDEPAVPADVSSAASLPASSERRTGTRWLRSVGPVDPARELPIYAHILAARDIALGPEAARLELLRFGLEYRDDGNLDSAARSSANRAAILALLSQPP